MHRFSKGLPLFLVAALAGVVCLTIEAQEEAPTFRSDTRLVVLHASVVGKDGQLVTTLKPNSFHVFEGKVEQPIKKVTREDVPVSLGLVIDNSGSMRDKRKKVEAASLAMVKASNPQDEVTIVNFNDDAYQDVLFTNDIKKLEEGVTRIDSKGGTAMRDAISATIDYMKSKSKRDKKVIVVVTDGDDNASSPAMTLEQLVQKAHQGESQILIYSIGLLNEESKRDANRCRTALRALADASGGSATFPKDIGDVEKATLQVAREIRNQYIIEYNPVDQNFNGAFRSVKVTVTAAGRPTVRTRSGYYATPDKPVNPNAAQVSSRQ